MDPIEQASSVTVAVTPPDPDRARAVAIMDGLFDPYILLGAIRDSAGEIVDFRCTEANAAACALSGLTHARFVGARLLDRLPGLAAALFEPFRQAVETGEPLVLDDFPCAQERRGPEVRRFDVRAVRIGDGLSCAWRDVTERWESQQALAARERRLTMMLEGTTDVVFENGPDDRYRWVSPSVEGVLGWRPEELVGRSGTELIHPDDFPLVLEARRHPRHGHVSVDVLRYRCADGSWRWVSGTSKELRAADGSLEGRVVGIRDITDIKLAEERFRELNEHLEQRVQERTAELEAANQELETFNSSISHDLRAPLRAINGFSSMLERHLGDGLDEQGRHYLDVIRESTLRMAALTEDLLGYSKLGRHAVTMGPIDWSRMLTTLHASLDGRIAATGATVEIVEPLAATLGDPVLLERILVNLIDNALTYQREGVPPRVSLSSVRSVAGVRVSVADEGIGIPDRHLSRIFDAFVRLHSEDAYPGSGIGLAIVRRAARLMGSEISVSSVVGSGSIFTFELPAVAV